MKARSMIVACGVVAALSGVNLCQPPTPRIAEFNVRAHRVAATTDVMAKAFLPDFDRVTQAVQVHDLDGLRSPDPIRYR